jgi:hypothetical protein
MNLGAQTDTDAILARAGELLKSPDQVYPSTDTRVLADGGSFILAIKGGDLQLLINGPKPQVFWSLKTTSGFRGDLSKVAYAGMRNNHSVFRVSETTGYDRLGD